MLMCKCHHILRVDGNLCTTSRWYALPNRHWNPKFKQLRKEKYIKVSLPDYDAIRKQDEMSMHDLRKELKKKGLPPHRPWRERPIHVSCSGSIFEPYTPPEDEQKTLLVSPGKARKVLDIGKQMWKNSRAEKKIQSYEANFEAASFPDVAKQVYIDANNALQARDEEQLHQLVTEKVFHEIWGELWLKTIKWEFLELLEPMRVVQIRTSNVMHDDNIFAQITVRMHSKQKLAIFDQFGRLYMGSEQVPRNVLEYIVFENHLSNLYGKWRIHGKIRPVQLDATDVVKPIYRKIASTNALPIEDPALSKGVAQSVQSAD